MPIGQRAFRIFFYSVWAVFLTVLTYVLGAAPLKLLRARAGRVGYWLIGTGLSVGFYFVEAKLMAAGFFALVVLMGVFAELEGEGFGFLVSAALTILINSLLAASAFAIWVSRVGAKWDQVVRGYVEEQLKPLMELNQHLQFNLHDLVLHLPSAVAILWMTAIYLAVFLETRLNGGLEVTERGAEMRRQLSRFRLPDVVVWIFIASLLGTFGGFAGHIVEVVSGNVMNICLLLFFFQGIAVVARFFESVRMGIFWQSALMILVVIYLFFFVSFIGLVDYWLDFRARLDKRRETLNPEV